MALYAFNFTHTMVMKYLLQSMNSFSYRAHIAWLVLYFVEFCVQLYLTLASILRFLETTLF